MATSVASLSIGFEPVASNSEFDSRGSWDERNFDLASECLRNVLNTEIRIARNCPRRRFLKAEVTLTDGLAVF